MSHCADPLDRVLSKLGRVSPSGSGFLAHCPAHEDRTASLSVARGDNGCVLVKCFAGCQTEAVVKALGLRMEDLFPDRNGSASSRLSAKTASKPARTNVPAVTVAKLAECKGLPPEFLHSLCMRDTPSGVEIPYFGEERQELATRIRSALVAKKGSRWPTGTKPAPYGLDRLPAARKKGSLLLVEGESDCWTLWHHGHAALGIPGATLENVLEAKHLEGIDKVFIWREPDKGGESFVRGLAVRLEAIGFPGEAFILERLGTKDSSALHLEVNGDHDRFEEALRNCVGAARPLGEALELLDPGKLRGEHPRAQSVAHVAVLVPLATVEPQPITWLWPGRIPLGKVTLIVGDPGLGKSLLTVDIAARLTRGLGFPDKPGETSRPAGVVFLTAEDDLADTLRPRLDAAGADVSRATSLQAVVRVDAATGDKREDHIDLGRDLKAVEEAIDSVENCALVVVDPVTAYLGGVDGNDNSGLRGLLTPLTKLAANRRVAIVAVTHLRKSGGKALHRSIGSLATIAAARAAWAVAKDPKDTDGRRRLLLPMKNNLAADSLGGLAFTVETGADGLPYIAWQPGDVHADVDEVLGEHAAAADGGASREAEEWLRENLAAGPRQQKEIEEDAKERGFSQKTLTRAKRSLGVRSKKQGFAGGWEWSLPPEDGQGDASWPSSRIPRDSLEDGQPELGNLQETPGTPIDGFGNDADDNCADLARREAEEYRRRRAGWTPTRSAPSEPGAGTAKGENHGIGYQP